MTHSIRSSPRHVWNLDGSKLEGEIPAAQERKQYLHELEIPHFLQAKQGLVSMIVPADMALQVDDVLQNEYGWEGIVVDIQERRPARGEWGDRKVDYVRVQFL